MARAFEGKETPKEEAVEHDMIGREGGVATALRKARGRGRKRGRKKARKGIRY